MSPISSATTPPVSHSLDSPLGEGAIEIGTIPQNKKPPLREVFNMAFLHRQRGKDKQKNEKGKVHKRKQRDIASCFAGVVFHIFF